MSPLLTVLVVLVLTLCYRPQRSWGKVMFLQVCVILFTGGVPDQVPPPGPGTPLDQVHPPRPGTPPGARYTPWARHTPLDQVHPPGPGTPWARHTPPGQAHTPGPGTPPGPGTHPPGPGRYGLRAGGTHPTGMHSCFKMFVRYIVLLTVVVPSHVPMLSRKRGDKSAVTVDIMCYCRQV